MMQFEWLTEELLRREYFDNDKTMQEIADTYGVSAGLVHKRFHKYGLTPRDGFSDKGLESFRSKQIGRSSPRKGKHLSAETKARISSAHKGKYKIVTEFGGHTRKRQDGYIEVYCPDNPGANADGYMMEHILIVENGMGRRLNEDEVVHHKNHIRDDNRIENLQVMTKHDHMSYHAKLRWAIKKGAMAYQ